MKKKTSLLLLPVAAGLGVAFYCQLSDRHGPALVATAPSTSTRQLVTPAGGLDNRPDHAAEATTEVTAAAQAKPREPDLAKLTAFQDWLGRWNAASPEDRKALREEGIRLATERREEFKALIATNPKLAVELAVSRVARQDLPKEIVAQLETPVSAVGEYKAYWGAPKSANDELHVQRFFEDSVTGIEQAAFVYGDMENAVSHPRLPLQGWSMDRRLAVVDNAVRKLDVGEIIPAGTPVEETCPVSGKTTGAVATGKPVTEDTPTVEIAGKLITLCNGSHVTVLEDQFRTYIQAAGSGGSGYFIDNFPGTSARSIGNLRCLYIRAAYPDEMTAPNTEEEAYADMAANARFYQESSYGKLVQTTVFTPLITLPRAKKWYQDNDIAFNGLGTIHNDAKIVAKALGYDSANFDCILLRVNGGLRDGTSWGGGSSVWLAWGGMNVINHEVGHSLNVGHANYWTTTDGTPYGNGSATSYGNPYDVMGSGGGFSAHYRTPVKRTLNWLPSSAVHFPKTNGTYRLYAFDQPRLEEGKFYSLNVAKNSTISYNLEYHANNATIANQALVLYGDNLCDTTQGSAGGKNDAGIQVGRTFSDWESDQHFTLLGVNNTAPASIDVVYNRGPFPGNTAPTLASMVPSATTINAGDSVTFTATANDANGDPLAYHWQFSDGVTGSNSAVFTRSFGTVSQVTAQLTVSDMKGGTDRKTVVINVGAHGKKTISGTVTAGGSPLAGALISGGGKECYTNTDGSYALAGISSGSQTLTATYAGYTFTPSFTNPINVTADVSGANWTAGGTGAFVTLTKVADATEGGSNGTFRFTRTGSTTADLVVQVAPVGGTAAKTTDYTFAPDYVAAGSYFTFTIPAGSASCDVTVAAVNDASAEGPETIALQMVSGAGYWSGTANSVVMTLNDNDTTLPMVAVSAPDPYATEGGGDTGIFTFARTGSTASSLNLSVAWSGTATNGTDYTTLPTTVTIPAGQSSVNVTVTPTNDAAAEVPESVIATVNTNAAYVRDSSATTSTVTISDDDVPVVTVSVPDAQASEAGQDAGTFLITRSGSTAAPLTVYYGLYGTAMHGTDYAEHTGQVTIPAGASSAPVVITPYDDDISETVPETVSLTVATFNDAYSVGVPAQGTLTITDNADLPLITVRASAIGTEGGANATVIFRSSGTGTGNVTVNYTVSGTATAGSDYTPLSGSVSVPVNGSNDTAVTIPVINDAIAESTETVVVTLTPGAGYKIYNDPSATALIRDNDSGGERVTVSAYVSSPAESGAAIGTFYFARMVGTTGALTVNYNISGTATSGSDYTGLTGSCVIPDGLPGVDVVMTPIDDSTAEGTETVTVTVAAAAGYSVDAPSSASFEIADNDVAAINVGFQQASLVTSEQPGELGEYRDIPVVLSAASASPVTVKCIAGGGDASGDDVDWGFVDAANGNAVIPYAVLTFAPGVTSQNVRIRVKNDGYAEGSEAAVLQLTTPLGVGLSPARGKCTVCISDDPNANFAFEERWSGSTIYTNNTWDSNAPNSTSFLSGFTPPQNVTDSYSRRISGTITAPSAGTYNFWIAADDAARLYLSTDGNPANKTQIAYLNSYVGFQSWDSNASQKSANIVLAAGQTLYLEVQHQEVGGGDHVSVAWQGPGFSRTPITFTTPDTAPRFVRMLVANSTCKESDGSEPKLMAVLDRPAGSTPVTVNYTVSGTATAGSDYTLTPGTLTFNAGEQMKLLPLSLLTDAVDEAPESIVVTLSGPNGATLAAPASHAIALLDASAPVVDSLFVTASSSQSAGTLIATATATPASGRTITGWSIVAGNPGNAFTIASNGQLTLVQPSLLPNPGGVQLIVRASDNAGASADGLINIICFTAAQPVVEQRWNGGATYDNEVWTGAPNYSGTLATLTAAQNVGDSYSRRLVTYLKPTVSGDYTFWVASDDSSRLYLGTDGYEASKVQLASVSGSTGFQSWDSKASQMSVPVTLQAGKLYWLEVQHQEGGGNDHASVAWAGLGISRVAIPGSVLVPAVAGLSFTVPDELNLTPPSIAITSPSSGTNFGSGDTITVNADVIAGADPVTSVDFYRGSTLVATDASAPYSASYTAATGAQTVTARANYASSYVTSAGVDINVWDSNPAVDADGDGYTNGLEVNLGTNPYSAASTPESIYASLRGWWKLDESSGSVADDSTGRVQDGALLNGATWESGIAGGGVSLNGTNQSVQIPALNFSANNATLSVWVKRNGTQTQWAGLVFERGSATGLDIGSNNELRYRWNDTAVAYDFASGLVIPDNTWTFCAVVVEPTKATLYMQAAGGAMQSAVNNASHASHAFNATAYLGQDSLGGRFFKGSLDDARIYARALSAAEIGQLYESVNPQHAPVFTNNPFAKSAAAEDAAYTGSTLAGSATDADAGDTLTFSKVSGPAWLSVAANGALSGTPSNSDVGSNSFTVRVSDVGGLTADATLNISVTNVNDAPVFAANPINGSGATEDGAYSGTLAGSASDVDAGDTLTYAKVSGPAWLNVAANGALSGMPTNGNVGGNSFTVRASDANGGFVDATLNIAVANVNDAPVFAVNPINGGAATEDSAYSGTLAGSASDADAGDTLTYSKVSGPAWLNVAANGVLSGTPANGDVGANSFTVRVTDGSAATADAILSIAVDNVNTAPVFASNPISGSDAAEDAAYSGALAGSATDADVGDTLTYSKVSGPAWLSVAANGALSGTPTNSDVGANSFTVRVSDGALTADATLNISVTNVNDVPVFASNPISGAAASENVAYSGTLAGSASDEDAGDAITYSKVSGPAWLSVAANGALSGTPTSGDVGANSFTVRVSDANSGTADATLNITVISTFNHGAWANLAGGSWPAAGNWNSGIIANGADKIADFSTLNLTADATVTLDGARTLGGLIFGDTTASNNWTLSTGSSGPLTLSLTSGTPTINVVNQTATVGTVIAGTGFQKAGNGTLVLSNSSSGALPTTLVINAGTVNMTGGNFGGNVMSGSGLVTVNAGATLQISSAHALGGSNTGMSESIAVNGGTLTLNREQYFNNLTLNGATVNGTNEFRASNATNWQVAGSLPTTVASRVSLYNAANFVVADVTGSAAADLVINGQITNTGALNKSGAGTLTVANSNNTYSGATNINAGTFNLIGVLAGGAMNVNNTGTLTGTGTLGGATTVAAGGTLAPGFNGIGTLTVNNTLSLAGTTAMEISKSGASLTADKVSGVSTVTYGGALTVTNVGPDALVAGSSFTLFSATSYSGSFATINLPALPNGLVWNTTQLATNGSIAVRALPVAANDSMATAEDVVGNFAVLANDGDADNDALEIQSVTQGAHGTVVINGAQVTYTPAANWSGTDSFDYTIADHREGTATATVSVTVTAVNDAPVLAALGSANATEDSAFSSSVAGAASDVDAGDSLTFGKVSGPAWLNVASNGAIYGTPTNSNVGSNSFTIRVTDAAGAYAEQVLVVDVASVNDAPVFAANPINGSGATEDSAYSGTLAGSASDVDAGDAITYAKVSGPAWLSVAANGALSGTPSNSDVGVNSFTVRVTDAGGLTADATLNIAVANVNDAPVFAANPINGSDATEDAAYGGTLAGSASDVDAGDAISYSKVSGPAWLSVASDGALSGTPGSGDVGANSFTVRASDGNGGTADATLNITVAAIYGNGAWTSLAGGSWPVGGNWSGGIIASGVDKTADFSTLNITANTTVTLDGDRTLGTLKFGDTTSSNGWALNAGTGGVVTLATTSGTPTILVNNQSATLGVALAGSQGFQKTGAGTLSLTAASTLSGKVTVAAGTLGVSAESGLGAIPASFTPDSLTLNGGMFSNLADGSIYQVTLSANRGVTLGTSGTLNGDSSSGNFGITANSVITGGSLTKNGGGYLALNAANTYTGGTTVSNGSGLGASRAAVELGNVNGFGPGNVSYSHTGSINALRYSAASGSVANNIALSTSAGITSAWIIDTGKTATFTGVINGGNATGILQVGSATAGTGTGTLQLNGVNTYAGTTKVIAGTLGGSGTLASAVDVQSGGALTPGSNGIGTLTVNNTLTLAGIAAMEISKSGATLTADKVGGLSTVTYGGTLTVTNVGPDALVAGNTFTLFSATSYSGSFATLNLPALSAGLAWETSQLGVNGTISVYAPNNAPVFTSNPISKSAATAYVAYTGQSLAGSATDADAGDTLTYSKVSGPAWLSVASNGALSGTPVGSDAGANSFSVKVTDAAGATATATLNISVNPGLPVGWSKQDIGAVGIAGNTTESGGTYTASGSGTGLANAGDQFQFAWQTLSGDGEIKARLTGMSGGSATSALAGVMIRESTATGSRFAFCGRRADGSMRYVRRTSTGGNISTTTSGTNTAPIWVRLVRAGNTITAYKSTNGTSWTTIGSSTVNMASQISIGIAVASGNNTSSTTAAFDNMTIVP